MAKVTSPIAGDNCTVYKLEDTSSVLLTPDSTPTKTNDYSASNGASSCSETDEMYTTMLHIKQVTTLGHCIVQTGYSQSDNSSCGSDQENQYENRGLIRSQSDTVLDSPKPSKAKVVKSEQKKEETTAVHSKPPKPGTLKGTQARPGRKKRTTKAESKKSQPSASKVSKDKRRSSSVPAKGQTDHGNKLMTDYFPVRRSSRVPVSKLKEQSKMELERAILSNCEDGLKVVNILGKGRGIVASKPFARGDFVVEYHGDLIDPDEAKTREKKYSAKPDIGCYMYYFKHNGKCYCVDATAESGKLGRLINHSKTEQNCGTKVVAINDTPYLILVAIRDISIGEELLYDYGDRNKESLAAHPWLKL